MSSSLIAIRRLLLVLAAGAGLVACATTPGEPSKADLAARGRNLALTECSQCHAVGSSAGNPTSATPSFASVAQTYRNTRLDWELEAISQVGHYRMPRKPLTSIDIADLTAYIRSLDRAPR